MCPQPSQDADPIAALKQVKNKILAAFEAAGLDDSTRSMWQGDGKEMYYRTLALNDLLLRSPRTARGFLPVAESAFEQVASELRALGDGAKSLLAELEQAF